jgi:hypothetical protein
MRRRTFWVGRIMGSDLTTYIVSLWVLFLKHKHDRVEVTYISAICHGIFTAYKTWPILYYSMLPLYYTCPPSLLLSPVLHFPLPGIIIRSIVSKPSKLTSLSKSSE